MEDWCIGYKVVGVDKKGGLHSWAFYKDRNGVRFYFVCCTTVPKKDCGPLGVFDTLEEAMETAVGFNHHVPSSIQVWMCVYRRSQAQKFWRVVGERENVPKTFVGSVCQVYDNLPKGTVFASAVRLIQRVV